MRFWATAVALLPTVFGAPQTASTSWNPAREVRGVLGAGESRVYRAVVTGPVRLVLMQNESDLALEVLGPAGKVVRAVNAFEWGEETATLLSPLQTVSARVRRPSNESRPATYRLRMIPLRGGESDLLWVDAEDAASEARTLLNQGTPDALKQALEAGRRAVNLWRQTGNASAERRASLLLADVLYYAGLLDEARQYYSDTLAGSLAADDFRSAAQALNNRGMVFWRSRSYAEAMDDLRQARGYWEQMPAQTGRGATLSNLGLVSWETGEYQAAQGYFAEAAKVLRTVGNRRGLAFVANNEALLQGSFGQYRLSTASFQRAAALFREAGDKLAEGRALANSARVYLLLGEVGQAALMVRRGFALVKDSGDERAVAESLNLLGEVEAAQGNPSEAIRRHREALTIARKIADRRAEANALANMGLVLVNSRQQEPGIASMKEALALYSVVGTPAVEASLWWRLALAQRDAGDLTGARSSIEAAIGIAEAVRGNVTGENLRVSFLASAHEYYLAGIDILMLRGESSDAFRMAEQSRARALLEAIANHEPSGSGPLPDRVRDLRRQWGAESLQLVRDSRDAENRRRRLGELAAALRAAEVELFGASGMAADAPGRNVPDIAQVQLQLLQDGDTALIEYSLGKQHGYAWVVQKDSVFPFRLPGSAVLERHARTVSELMRRGPAVSRADVELKQALTALSGALVGPALPHLKATRLLIVPEGGFLQYVPFAALPLTGGDVLIDRFEVVEAPSTAVMLSLAQNRPARVPAPRPLLLVADPVFQADDARLGGNGARAIVPERLARLPFSRKEALDIGSLLPEGSPELLLGFEATKQALTSPKTRGFRVIHIATHDILDLKDPNKSGLVFSKVNRDGSPLDALLSINEVAGLRWNAELVVLSGCDTALGGYVQGEGLMSLARGFLRAGAARVVASRWRVDDESSAALFKHFYRAMWETGLSPAAALRKAQIELRAEARWRSPFYWASLMIQGEP